MIQVFLFSPCMTKEPFHKPKTHLGMTYISDGARAHQRMVPNSIARVITKGFGSRKTV